MDFGHADAAGEEVVHQAGFEVGQLLKLFGFGLEGINYEAEAEPMQALPSA